MLGYVSAVSYINAESNIQVTDFPSGLVISHIDYRLMMDLFDWRSSQPQSVTDQAGGAAYLSLYQIIA